MGSSNTTVNQKTNDSQQNDEIALLLQPHILNIECILNLYFSKFYLVGSVAAAAAPDVHTNVRKYNQHIDIIIGNSHKCHTKLQRVYKCVEEQKKCGEN